MSQSRIGELAGGGWHGESTRLEALSNRAESDESCGEPRDTTPIVILLPGNRIAWLMKYMRGTAFLMGEAALDADDVKEPARR